MNHYTPFTRRQISLDDNVTRAITDSAPSTGDGFIDVRLLIGPGKPFRGKPPVVDDIVGIFRRH